MPCLNLKGEMAKKDITIEEISKLLGIHRNSVANKLNGDSAFTIDEAFKIQGQYFPTLSLAYLFSTEEPN
jgi:plasmid maintenance system antidote protein VapI